MTRKEATSISPQVRETVLKRDNHRCIVCGSNFNLQLHHCFVNRSHGGLGVKENLVTLCCQCHFYADNGKAIHKSAIDNVIDGYMKSKYPKLDKSILSYRKENYE